MGPDIPDAATHLPALSLSAPLADRHNITLKRGTQLKYLTRCDEILLVR